MKFRPLKDRSQKEMERALLLHRVCANIASRIAMGETLRKAIQHLVKRSKRGDFNISTPRGKCVFKLAEQTLYRHFRVWERKPSPCAFLLRYRSGKPRIPSLLVREFLRRALRAKTPNVTQAYESLIADWHAGKNVPGLGTWRTWVRKYAPEFVGNVTAPKFPFTARTFHRSFTKREIKALLSRRGMLESVKKALADFEHAILAKAETTERSHS